MKRLPVFATLVVLAVVAVMVALGFWQLARSEEKGAALARYDANLAAPPLILRDRVNLAGDLFRRAEAECGPADTRLEGAGRFGFRLLADCRTLDGGQTLVVQLGTTRDLGAKADWKGGRVTGFLTEAPDSRSVLREAFERREPTPMIVADPPLAGLSASPRPSAAEIPNNHRSYAVQWFSFAALALIIFGLALRQRRRAKA
jgi:surfeit locus 1 family protein